MKKIIAIPLASLLALISLQTQSAQATVKNTPHGPNDSNPGIGRQNEEKDNIRFKNQNMKNGSGNATSSTERQMENSRERAIKQIENRITALESLKSRLDKMKKLSDGQKSDMQDDIDDVISELNKLKDKINDGTDADELKSDIQAITKTYRVYALVMPKIQILASADRILATRDMISTVAEKLRTRMSNLDDGANTSEIEAALDDLDEKLDDAHKKADDAIDKVSGLEADNGDKDTWEANLQALKEARDLIKTAHNDLIQAQKDARSAAKSIKNLSEEDDTD